MLSNNNFTVVDTKAPINKISVEDTPDNVSPVATLLRLSDIPDYLTPDRRKNWFDQLVNKEVAVRQKKFTRNNPTSHAKKLIDFINDYLDKHRLADTPVNQRKAKNAFYLGTKDG